jgi:hypothetical protein
MAWPKGRPRPRKVTGQPEPVIEIEEPVLRAPDQPPADWRKGALLNVRNHGAEYIVTLHPAEYDPRHEDQCMKFTNVGECQGFVSAWYARESHDPRAR